VLQIAARNIGQLTDVEPPDRLRSREEARSQGRLPRSGSPALILRRRPRGGPASGYLRGLAVILILDAPGTILIMGLPDG